MFKHQVYEGLTAWAAWGDTGWRCVRVLSRGWVFAKVQRENPKTGAVLARRGKARIAEMVHRDPRKKGSDKPRQTPAAMFAQARGRTAQETASEPVSEPGPTLHVSQGEPADPVAVAALIDLIPDGSTDAEW